MGKVRAGDHKGNRMDRKLEQLQQTELVRKKCGSPTCNQLAITKVNLSVIEVEGIPQIRSGNVDNRIIIQLMPNKKMVLNYHEELMQLKRDGVLVGKNHGLSGMATVNMMMKTGHSINNNSKIAKLKLR